MQKKYVLCLVMTSIFMMHGTQDDNLGQNYIPTVEIDYSDPFSGSSEDLQKVRKGPQDEEYLDAMIKGGIEGIEKKKKEEKDKVENLRSGLKKRTCSSRGWSAQQNDTVVYYWDQKIDAEADALNNQHQTMATKYTDNYKHIQGSLGQSVRKALSDLAAVFGRMHVALTSCERGDQKCYDRFGAPEYDKMSNSQYRQDLVNAIFEDALKESRQTNRDREGISLLKQDQLEQILCQNKEIATHRDEIVATEKEICEYLGTSEDRGSSDQE